MSEPRAPDPTAAMLARLAGDHTALTRRVAGIEDRVEDLANALDGIESVLEAASALASRLDSPTTVPTRDETAAEPNEGPDTGLDMRRLVSWVRDNVALLLERKIPQTGGYPYWCRQWWMHPEAIARLEAARRTWAEAVVAGGSAMVVYFEHLDHQLAILCGENGPFCSCTAGEHREDGARTLGQDDPPESYFLEFEQTINDQQGQQDVGDAIDGRFIGDIQSRGAGPMPDGDAAPATGVLA